MKGGGRRLTVRGDDEGGEMVWDGGVVGGCEDGVDGCKGLGSG